jgi:hypothetical protein
MVTCDDNDDNNPLVAPKPIDSDADDSDAEESTVVVAESDNIDCGSLKSALVDVSQASNKKNRQTTDVSCRLLSSIYNE